MTPNAETLVVVATLACVTATTSAAQETSPFPHGWVVFAADTDGGTQCCDLFKLRTDGSGLRRLARGTDDSPTFAPDGKRVAFSASTTRGGKGIFAVNLDGSGRARLTTGDGSEPEYSPDGKRIAFLRGVDLYVMRADGGGQRRLRRGWPEVGPPSWTPDGTSIVLSASQGESYSSLFLYTLAARTGRIERQTLLQKNNGAPGPGGGGGALLSPDGRTVVFTGIKPTCGECDPAYAVFRKELPRGPVRQVCDGCSADSWSADSRVIAWGGRRAIHLRVLRDGRMTSIPVGGHVYTVVAVALQPR